MTGGKTLWAIACAALALHAGGDAGALTTAALAYTGGAAFL